MHKSRKLQTTPESQLFTITDIATGRNISRDCVIHVIKTRHIPHVSKIGNTKVYSPDQRKMVEAELDRIAVGKGR